MGSVKARERARAGPGSAPAPAASMGDAPPSHPQVYVSCYLDRLLSVDEVRGCFFGGRPGNSGGGAPPGTCGAAPSPAAGPDGALSPPPSSITERLQLQRQVLLLPLLDRQGRAHQAGGSHERGARRKWRVRAPVQRPALVWHDQQVLQRGVDADPDSAQRDGCAAGSRKGAGARRREQPSSNPLAPPPSRPARGPHPAVHDYSRRRRQSRVAARGPRHLVHVPQPARVPARPPAPHRAAGLHQLQHDGGLRGADPLGFRQRHFHASVGGRRSRLDLGVGRQRRVCDAAPTANILGPICDGRLCRLLGARRPASRQPGAQCFQAAHGPGAGQAGRY